MPIAICSNIHRRTDPHVSDKGERDHEAVRVIVIVFDDVGHFFLIAAHCFRR